MTEEEMNKLTEDMDKFLQDSGYKQIIDDLEYEYGKEVAGVEALPDDSGIKISFYRELNVDDYEDALWDGYEDPEPDYDIDEEGNGYVCGVSGGDSTIDSFDDELEDFKIEIQDVIDDYKNENPEVYDKFDFDVDGDYEGEFTLTNVEIEKPTWDYPGSCDGDVGGEAGLNVYVYVTKKPTEESLNEDTIKTKDGKWTNKGEDGTHGEFNTKKAADAQRKAMFANGFHEDLEEPNYKYGVTLIDVVDGPKVELEKCDEAFDDYDLAFDYATDTLDGIRQDFEGSEDYPHYASIGKYENDSSLPIAVDVVDVDGNVIISD